MVEYQEYIDKEFCHPIKDTALISLSNFNMPTIHHDRMIQVLKHFNKQNAINFCHKYLLEPEMFIS